MAAISRMQLLRGDLRGERQAIRPPWAVREARFVEQCDRCGRCIPVCPQGLLSAGRGGFPQLDFQRGECIFCRRCLEHCQRGALRAVNDEQPWPLHAMIGRDCLTRRGVVCRACGEQCESRAITFRLGIGGVARPEVDIARCTGCGACVRPCPVSALTMHHPSRSVEVSV